MTYVQLILVLQNMRSPPTYPPYYFVTVTYVQLILVLPGALSSHISTLLSYYHDLRSADPGAAECVLSSHISTLLFCYCDLCSADPGAAGCALLPHIHPIILLP